MSGTQGLIQMPLDAPCPSQDVRSTPVTVVRSLRRSNNWLRLARAARQLIIALTGLTVAVTALITALR